MKIKLNRLPQELVNQIAAGEVIERPASIIKELIDNSIDAGSTKIRIKVEKGGRERIEVSDNGIGIEKDNLTSAFEAHTTSKISSIDDLNKLITMGFRGEALSTIVSVAKVEVSSKVEADDFGYEVEFNGIIPNSIRKSARDNGTTVAVSNLFQKIPAREKFLKTPETEYRKILEILIPYFLQYPNIHFTLTKDGKEVYNLPATETQDDKELNLARIKSVIKSSFTQSMFSFSSKGSGIEISGYCAHPKDNVVKTADQYIFINKRSIWDFGIAKSIKSAFSRYIPNNTKVPFIVNISIDPKLIDVNVHPRKEEVRFENPYRVYSAVESAVLSALETLLKEEKGLHTNYSSIPIEYNTSKEQDFSKRISDSPNSRYSSSSMFNTTSNEIRFNNKGNVEQSLEFSRQMLGSNRTQPNTDSALDYPSNNYSPDIDVNKVFQIFNKYIVIENEHDLIMIDQHAAAERVTFEKLENSLEGQNLDTQNLLIPTEVEVSQVESLYLLENQDFFSKLKFSFEIVENVLKVNSIPAIFSEMNIDELFKSILNISDDQRDVKKSFDIAKENILASLACHGSIRKGQKLSPYEGLKLYQDLLTCKNPYSCPHGRPAIWKQRLEDIDSNFYRTY